MQICPFLQFYASYVWCGLFAGDGGREVPRCSYEVEADRPLVMQKGVAGGQAVHRGVSERCCSPFAGE